jgi:exodeoxyribonuclease VII small subunit
MTDTPTPPRFEDQLQKLEALIERLEAGEGDLDSALAAFQEGMALVVDCKNQLALAEVKVETILATLEDEEIV